MDKQTNFIIRFKELSIGKHFFEFEIKDSFFSQFENAVVQKGQLSVKVGLEKLNSMLVLDFVIEGEVAVECDRCLYEFYMPLVYKGRLIASFSEHGKKEEDESEDGSAEEVETMVLSSSEDRINLSQYCYDSIGVSLPIQRVHPNDESGNCTCNQEMMERLKALLVN